jgi:hypothetical protein
MTYYQFICNETGGSYGSFKTVYMDLEDLLANDWITCIDWEDGEPYYAVEDDADGNRVIDNPNDLVGWYWVAGSPGCLWDGTPMGPFVTEEEAINGANDYA